MSSPAITNNQTINPALFNTSTTLQEDLIASGKKFAFFIGKNVLNLTGIAIGTALLVNQWYVSGVALLAFASYNVISNAAASQTWIPRSIRQFIVEKGGFVVGGATAIALIATQSHILGISLLIYTSYKFMDSVGLVPRSVSLFMERLFPWRVLPSLSLVDATPMGIFNFVSLFTYLRPVERFIYEKVDFIIHKIFDMDCPELDDIVASFERPALSYAKMKEILNSKDSDFSLDVRHCSRKVTEMVSMDAEDRHFEKLLAMANSTTWSPASSKEILASKHFQTFLSEEFPDVSRDELKKNSDYYAKQLGIAKGMSGPAFANQWLKNRFTNVVDVLNGRITCRVKGSQSELDAAIIDTAKILPYLEKINKETDPIHKAEAQSILFRLALNSSSCRSKDIRAIAGNILHESTQKHFNEVVTTPQNLAKRYEFKLLNTMQNIRLTKIQLLAKNTVDTLTSMKDFLLPPASETAPKPPAVKRPLKSSELQDEDLLVGIHRYGLSFGFLPVDKFDRENSALPLHYVSKVCNRLFDWVADNYPTTSIYQTYKRQIDSDVIDCSKEEFWTYIEYLLDSNHLSVSEKADIKKLFNDQRRSDIGTQKNFQRLLLVSLGILKKAA
jgi:hypothetical protein